MSRPDTDDRTPHADGACPEYRGLTRRGFLGRAALASTAPAWLPRVALGAGGAAQRDTLVHLFLRGGMDGLTACVPWGDAELYLARPTLAVPPPGAPNGALDLDGFYGLAPAAAPLLAPWGAGQLAIVHAAGSTDPTRSHFDAMKAIELGVPQQPYDSVTTGWLARHLTGSAPVGDGTLRALALEDLVPQHLAGAPATLPIPTPETFDFPGDPATAELRERVLRELYRDAVQPLAGAALSSFDTIDLLDTIDFAGYVPTGGAAYPDTELGTKLRSAAALVKADVGVESISIDYGGWDHHNQLGPLDGTMAQMLGELAVALEAFWLDLGGGMDRTTVVAMTEFGRRVAQNGSLGVDHGHGGCMLVMGGHVVGGTVHGVWPGLHPDQLDQGDLAVTTDYRDVIAEILVKRLGATDVGSVFPNHAPTFHGIVT